MTDRPRRRTRYQRSLVRSAEQSERAADRVMAGMATGIADMVRRIAPEGPLTDAGYQTIMEGVDRELAAIYGPTRATAGDGVLGAVIAAEAHNARKRVAGDVVAGSIAPAVRRDHPLQQAMGMREDEIR